MSSYRTALITGLILVAVCLPVAAQTYTLQAFDVPYAPPKANTYALGINNRGAVVGYIYYQSKNVVGGTAIRGFKRNADGVFERPIDDPGALPVLDTLATGVNDSGVVAGIYFNYSIGNSLSFLLSNGIFTAYSLPGRDTYVFGINNKEDLVGEFTDVNLNAHGFTSIHGVVSAVNYPGGHLTRPYGIAADETIVGSFKKNSRLWGFVRGPAGQYRAFQVPGALDTTAYGVNNVAHKIVGIYYTAGITHGFAYHYITDITTTVDWPDPTTYHTEVTGINSQGIIVGWSFTKDSQGHALPAFSFIGTPQ